MLQLFDDVDFDPNFQTNNEYAKNYNTWRNKEEIHKLKTKYGEDIDQEDSSSSSEDEDGVELTENLEKDFFKTLACLKNKDPRIYDENVQFFAENDEEVDGKKLKKKKDKVVTLKDYERNLILEKGGVLSDEEDDGNEENRPRSPTYVEEQKQLKENLKKILDNVKEDENDDEWGGIFQQRQKSKEEKDKEEADYKKWLIGQKKDLEDKTVESDLKPLKDYWNKPDLDSGEKFLRDYILNKKFLEEDRDDYVPTYDEIVHDSDENLSNDEENVNKQDEFEHKFNFRFEEPDQEFIKQYPRTIEHSLRKQDTRRKEKRQEVKDRKKNEKEEKMMELKKLQEMKRMEIEDKLDKLKEITGSDNLGFSGEDIDGDFDPEEHDRKMAALFSDEFYAGEEDDQKPQFPDLDEELEIENWDRYNVAEENAPHCEDDDFNMDCDYDPGKSTQNELIESSRGKKKRKRKSKFIEALNKPKPKYDPNDKNYEKYFDEYYKLDCEDIIGDIPCRFKYRKVIPNDFGLSAEEILMANERELNKWCSLKKAIQLRPDHVEKYEQVAYQRKGQNIDLKKKILPSLFSNDVNDQNVESGPGKGKKKNNSVESKHPEDPSVGVSQGSTSEVDADQTGSNESALEKEELPTETVDVPKEVRKKMKKKKTPDQIIEEEQASPSLSSPKKKKSKVVETNNPEVLTSKAGNSEDSKRNNVQKEKNSDVQSKLKKKKKKKKKPAAVPTSEVVTSGEASSETPKTLTKMRKRKNSNSDGGSKKTSKKFKFSKQNDDTKLSSISDARLAAYGINPKKFKNKLKYKN